MRCGYIIGVDGNCIGHIDNLYGFTEYRPRISLKRRLEF